MDNTANAFLTQTIVGAPFSVLLGHQLEADQLSVHGIEIPLRGGDTQLSRVWKDWMVLDCESEPSGKPRRRRGRVRRWLERHALVLALLNTFGLTVSAIFWGFISWT